MFVINCKNYAEASGDRLGGLLEAAHRASSRYGVEIAVAPPQHMLGAAAGSRCTVLAQHSDDRQAGGTTGFVVPELLKESGVAGSLINHSEHRIPGSEIGGLVSRLRGLGMISIVCVQDAAEAGKYAGLCPDYVAVEPPELIGSGRAVSTHRPDLIEDAAAAVGDRSTLLCGAGITSAEDVAGALRLGAGGILVASGIVKSGDWDAAISGFASSMV